MMKQEFEKLAGYEVSSEDYYSLIEPMYMATNLDKSEFVKCISKKRFALKTKEQLISKAKKIAEQYKTEFTADGQMALETELDEIRKEIHDRWYPCYKVYINWTHKMGNDTEETYPNAIEIYRGPYTSTYFKLA